MVKPESVLRSGPAMVVTTLLALAAVAGVGWKARDLVERANAAVPEDVREDIRSIRADIVKIKCILNVDNTCPR